MSESDNSVVVYVNSRSEKMMGNQNASRLSYDERQIRDALKGSIYRAVAGLNMTMAEAEIYYNRPEATILERMFYKAICKDNWPVFEAFMGRTLGVTAIKQTLELTTDNSPVDLTKLSDDELHTLRSIHIKLASNSEK